MPVWPQDIGMCHDSRTFGHTAACQRWTWLLWGAVALGAAVFGAGEAFLRYRYSAPRYVPSPMMDDAINIVALGDSITAGSQVAPVQAWPAVLAARLSAGSESPVTWRVINAGLSGDTVAYGRARLKESLLTGRPWAVLIAFGLNDCRLTWPGDPQIPPASDEVWGSYAVWWIRTRVLERVRQISGQHLTPPVGISPAPVTAPHAFTAALEAMVEASTAAGAQPVLLTMPPLGQAATDGVPGRLEQYAHYNYLIRQAALQTGVPLVELEGPAPQGSHQADGLHLTPVGQAWLADQVYKQLDAAGVWKRLSER